MKIRAQLHEPHFYFSGGVKSARNNCDDRSSVRVEVHTLRREPEQPDWTPTVSITGDHPQRS